MNIKSLLMGVNNESDLLNYYNATIFYKELIPEINGYVYNNKGIFLIVINKHISDNKKRNTLIHELAHIELNQLEQVNKDFLFAFCRQGMEDEADIYIKNILKELK